MCIIAVKPAGVAIDETAKEWLRNGACNNTHGAGLMYSDGKVVHFNKGWGREDKMKTIEGFIEYAESLPVEYPVVIHFRNASSKPWDAGNTHPIPLFGGNEVLRQIEGTCDIALVHNGIVKTVPPDPRGLYSDTQMLVKELNKRSLTANELPDELLRKFTTNKPPSMNNKYAVMTSNKLNVVGDFIIEGGGWLFSNDYYIAPDMR